MYQKSLYVTLRERFEVMKIQTNLIILCQIFSPGPVTINLLEIVVVRWREVGRKTTETISEKAWEEGSFISVRLSQVQPYAFYKSILILIECGP